MSDVRALLKAKRQETRVTHPLASYSSNGQLRCVACGTGIKQASAWDGHVASKAHRVSVIKMKEEQAQRELQQKEEEEQPVSGVLKRKTTDGGDEDEYEDVGRTADMAGGIESKRRKTAAAKTTTTTTTSPQQSNGFPEGFFSDPSRSAPPRPSSEVSDSDDPDLPHPPPQTQPAPPITAIDPLEQEWAQFQQAVLNSTPQTQHDPHQQAYKRATVFAEPELNDVTEGIPSQLQGSLETGEESSVSVLQPPDQEQLRKQKEIEEKELIMDRFMEEERAQEEADARVTLLKSRLDALKKKRQAAKASKIKNT